MKLKKFVIYLCIFTIICFGSLSKLLILKGVLVILFSHISSRVRRRKYLSDIKALKNELTLNRSILVSGFNYNIDIDELDLTESEYEVLEYICRYSPTNSQLCRKFGKSISTVKNQIKVIMDKVGVDNRFDLIMSCRNNFE